MRYLFGPHTLDLGTVELLCDGEPVDLEPRTFSVLAHLIRHRDRVVPKEELLDEIWGDRFVGESALTSQIKHARSAVGDDGRTQRVIRTQHRVGYRFVAPVVEDVPVGEQSPTASVVWPAGGRARLVGRDADRDDVVRRLTDHRLVTITGTGGIGKTALAAEIASDHAALAPDGAWICELLNTRDPDTVGHVALAALGEGQQSDADPVESVLRILERRRALLVVDNCEHVLDAARDLIDAILRRCPDVRIVATSRSPLGVEGESVHPLAPLSIEAAAAFFTSRAADHGATVDSADPALPDLCRRLDCVPLALELAAARARLLSPTEMLDLVDDRFRLLHESGPPDGDDRHRSLRRTIEWSWDGLSEDDQQLLARLSVFVGSFTLDDARAVALDGADPLDVVDALGRLVDRSWLVPVPSSAGRTRFRLMESVRAFAAEHLADPATTRRAHARHYAELAESLDATFQTDAVDDALDVMGAAWDNLRAAVGHAAAAGDPAIIRRIVRAVGPFADVFQIYEVLDWCRQAELDQGLPEDGSERMVAADALAIQARMLAHRGHHTEARALATQAHQLGETHTTLLSVVWCAYYSGDLDLVAGSIDRLISLSRSDRGFDRGFAEGFAAIVVAVRQEAEIASTTVTPADAEKGVLGVQDCLTEGLRLCTADPQRAAGLLQAVVDSSLRNDYRLHLGAAASTLTQITLPGRPVPEAMRILRRTLQLYLDRSMWMLISADTVMAAKLLAGRGDVETASRLIGARGASGYAVGLSEVLRGQLEDELRRELGDRFDELAAQGSAWRPPEAGEAAIAALDRFLGRSGGAD